MKKLSEPSLTPPSAPDDSECAEPTCDNELGDSAHAIELPGINQEIWVCSERCAADYVSAWSDAMYEAHEDSKLWN